MAKTLTILIYHRVLDRPDVLRPHEVDRELFARQLLALKRFFNVVPLREGVRRLNERSLPRNAVSITFDDGYRDNLTNATPLLKAMGMEGTFFIATGFAGCGMMFNDVMTEAIRKCSGNAFVLPDSETSFDLGSSAKDRRATLAKVLEHVKYLEFDERQAVVDSVARFYGVDARKDGMMSHEEIQAAAAAGMEIGAHTIGHPILQGLDDQAARTEIEGCKSLLENIIDREVVGFAYPNGKFGKDFGLRDAELARSAGFNYAVTTDWASASYDDDLFRLPRIAIASNSATRSVVTVAKSKVSRQLRS